MRAAKNAVGRIFRARRQQQIELQRRENEAEYREAVESLTNWERNQWARAGYPGMRQKDLNGPGQFVDLRYKRAS